MAYVLHYWPLKAKNIASLLALEVSGANYEVGPPPGSKGGDLWAEWLEMKPNTPWGYLPNLDTPDGKKIGNELAILQYIGRKFPALAGESDDDFTKSQELIHQGEELYQKLTKLAPTILAKDKDPKAFQDFWDGADPNTHSAQQGLRVYLNQFDKYLDASGKCTTSGWTLGECKLWGTLILLDYMEPGFSFPPNVAAFMKRYGDDSRVQKVKKSIEGCSTYFIKPGAA